MAQLDKSQPFGEVIGHPFQQYEQGNKMFNGAGNEIDSQGKLVDEAPPAPTITEPEQKPAETQSTEPEATTTGDKPEETAPEPEPEEMTIVEASMEHRGGGYYKVFDTKGDLVGEDFKKAEAEAKVTELQQNADQISKALGDG